MDDRTLDAEWQAGVDPGGPPVLRLRGSAQVQSGRQFGLLALLGRL